MPGPQNVRFPSHFPLEATVREKAANDGMTHLSTGVAIVQDGKILGLRRIPDDYPGGMFELPGGGIEDGETFMDALKREVSEETGLTVRTFLGMFSGFGYSTPKKPRIRQFNFLVTVDDSGVKLSPEHDAYEWVDEESLAKLPMTDEMRTKGFYGAFALLNWQAYAKKHPE